MPTGGTVAHAERRTLDAGHMHPRVGGERWAWIWDLQGEGDGEKEKEKEKEGIVRRDAYVSKGGVSNRCARSHQRRTNVADADAGAARSENGNVRASISRPTDPAPPCPVSRIRIRRTHSPRSKNASCFLQDPDFDEYDGCARRGRPRRGNEDRAREERVMGGLMRMGKGEGREAAFVDSQYADETQGQTQGQTHEAAPPHGSRAALMSLGLAHTRIPHDFHKRHTPIPTRRGGNAPFLLWRCLDREASTRESIKGADVQARTHA
ncbi:hypothetical protein C8F04DRAFT_1182277 [Mycena alexandri]|uniref:Uncharacterized protein n=1 Tax=Mycena alexandri TaxID=1745969 RepID=A0AAD6SZW9_9AGAR|nr:hypothetical protein C8F04DRAFT_1182277 [Mycena alexandri]